MLCTNWDARPETGGAAWRRALGWSHLTILPDLGVRLPAALDLLHQSPEGLQRAGVDEREALGLLKGFICAQTKTPADDKTRRLSHKSNRFESNNLPVVRLY